MDTIIYNNSVRGFFLVIFLAFDRQTIKLIVRRFNEIYINKYILKQYVASTLFYGIANRVCIKLLKKCMHQFLSQILYYWNTFCYGKGQIQIWNPIVSYPMSCPYKSSYSLLETWYKIKWTLVWSRRDPVSPELYLEVQLLYYLEWLIATLLPLWTL